MPRRKWDARTKALIVLQGLKGTPVSQLCTEHQISQAQYYEWRDQLLANASKAFETHQQADQVARLARENSQLKRVVADLTLEVKKNRRAARMSRRTSPKVTERNAAILSRISQLKLETSPRPTSRRLRPGPRHRVA